MAASGFGGSISFVWHPDSGNPGGITSGTGIDIDGSHITNTGVVSLTAGTGITVTPGTGGEQTITNDGVVSLTAGTGIAVTPGVGGDYTIDNDGVVSLTAGSGISITPGVGGDYTITNTAPSPGAPDLAGLPVGSMASITVAFNMEDVPVNGIGGPEVPLVIWTPPIGTGWKVWVDYTPDANLIQGVVEGTVIAPNVLGVGLPGDVNVAGDAQVYTIGAGDTVLYILHAGGNCFFNDPTTVVPGEPVYISRGGNYGGFNDAPQSNFAAESFMKTPTGWIISNPASAYANPPKWNMLDTPGGTLFYQNTSGYFNGDLRGSPVITSVDPLGIVGYGRDIVDNPSAIVQDWTGLGVDVSLTFHIYRVL